MEGSSGRRAFLRKRELAGRSDASWPEIDLLRGDTRTVAFPGMPTVPYFAHADQTDVPDRRQLAWPTVLRERLPRLAVPLRPGEPSATLDLQAALEAVYERAGYDLDVTCREPPDPPLEGEDAQWADGLLRERQLRT